MIFVRRLNILPMLTPGTPDACGHILIPDEPAPPRPIIPTLPQLGLAAQGGALSAVMLVSCTIRRPVAPPEADGEKIALGTEASDAEIDDLHDYERIYRVPWLRQHIVRDFTRTTRR
jgi:hypothetical protein